MVLRLVTDPPVEEKRKKKVNRRKTVDQLRYTKVRGNGTLVGDPRSQDLALHSVIGHSDLQPFTWIEIEGDSYTSFFDNGQFGFNSIAFSEAGDPDKRIDSIFRRGLVEVILRNERKKRPVVEISLVEDRYKERDNSNSRLNRFKIGVKFYVYFGYRAAYTKWGPFRVDISNIEFAEGTATLKVIGAMAGKASRITTSELYSLSEKSSAVKTLSAICGITIDDQELLEDERVDVDNHELVTANTDAVEILYGDLGDQLGIEVFHFPEEGDQLRLSTPYSLDLIKKGVRPNRITYGYPTSNASAIQVKRQKPKYKNRGKGTSSAVVNKESKRGGVIETFELALGYQFNSQGGVDLVDTHSIGARELDTSFNITGLTSDQIKNKIEELHSGEYPKESFRISEDKNFTISAKDSLSEVVKNKRFLFLYDKKVITKVTEKRTIGWTIDPLIQSKNPSVYTLHNTLAEINRLYALEANARKNSFFKDTEFLYGTNDTTGERQVTTITAYFLETTNLDKQPEIGPQTKKAPNQEKSTKKIKRTYDDEDEVTLLRETFERHWIAGNLDYDVQKELGTVARLPGGRGLKKDLTPGEGGSREVEQDARTFFNKIRKRFSRKEVKQYFEIIENDENGDTIKLKLFTSGKVSQSNSDEESEPVAGDSTPKTAPKGKKAEVAKEQRKSTLISAGYKELTITMKAGDYTHRVGNIIQLVDVHSLYNGYYRISKVTHRVSQDGFQTEIQARDAKAKSNTSIKKKKTNNATPNDDSPEAKKERQQVKNDNKQLQYYSYNERNNEAIKRSQPLRLL